MRVSEEIARRFARNHPTKIDLSLERILAVLEKLGRPEKKLKNVIHVAGTNGKGSTIAFLRAILEADGQSVHVFTSPHLVTFTERIRLGSPSGGHLTSEAQLYAAFSHIERVNGDAPLSFFEFLTATALFLFAETPHDAVLIETGLGGRCDATNVFENPAATVITSVSEDHKEILGATLPQIFSEKIGILKKSAPAIFAPQAPEIRKLIPKLEGAAAIFAEGRDFFVRHHESGAVYEDNRDVIPLKNPGLKGAHQNDNAGTAIAALRVLMPSFPVKTIAQGLTRAVWPGRMQKLTGRLSRLTPSSVIWLDGAHNEASMKALARTLCDIRASGAQKPIACVLGMMKTKPLDVLTPLRALISLFCCVTIEEQANARPSAALCEALREAGANAEVSGTIPQALKTIASHPWPSPPIIIITGSLYLCGDALRLDASES